MKALLLTLTLLYSFLTANAIAQELSSAQLDQLIHAKIDAIAANDYQQFLQKTDARFRESVRQEQFEAVSGALASTLKPGYQAAYLGALNQEGFKVHLWKITPKNPAADHLVKMAIRSEEIAGFWIE